MSLVTEQGRRVKAQFDEQAQALTQPLLSYVQGAGPVSVSELLTYFSAESERSVREAMWLLLDEHAVRITEDRKLAVEVGA
jgi:hypothetical protein